MERGGTNNAICVLLFYSAMCMGGQHWTYKGAMDLIRNHRLDTECFASPLNSLTIATKENRDWASPPRDEGGKEMEMKFCSISKAVDGPFGSIGDFFSSPYIKGRAGLSVNPPYTEFVLERAARRATQLLDDAWINRVAFIGPDWDDAAFVSILTSSPHFVSKETRGWQEMGIFNFDWEKSPKADKKIFVLTLERKGDVGNQTTCSVSTGASRDLTPNTDPSHH